MRRRTAEPGSDGVPHELRVFVAADWPGATVRDRLAAWKVARVAWLDENGWPGGPLAMLVEYRDTARLV